MDTIEVTNGTVKKTLQLEVQRGRAFVIWPTSGQHEVDLMTGAVMSEMLALEGIYRIDCETGRVEGTRYSVIVEDMVRLPELRPGAKIQLLHNCGNSVRATAEVVDSLPSEGILRVYVSTREAWSKDSQWNVGRRYKTGWSVTGESLTELRTKAGVVAQAS